MGSHATLDAPPERRFLVLRKVDLGSRPHLGEQRLQRRRGIGGLGGHRNAPAVLHDQADFRAHVFRRQDPVDATGVDRRLWHSIILSGARILREGEATGGLVSVNAVGAIPAGAGKNDTDARLGGFFGE